MDLKYDQHISTSSTQKKDCFQGAETKIGLLPCSAFVGMFPKHLKSLHPMARWHLGSTLHGKLEPEPPGVRPKCHRKNNEPRVVLKQTWGHEAISFLLGQPASCVLGDAYHVFLSFDHPLNRVRNMRDHNSYQWNIQVQKRTCQKSKGFTIRADNKNRL